MRRVPDPTMGFFKKSDGASSGLTRWGIRISSQSHKEYKYTPMLISFLLSARRVSSGKDLCTHVR